MAIADAAAAGGAAVPKSPHHLSPMWLPEGLWASRTVVMLHAFAPIVLWFKPVSACIALFWLVYRASQVVNTSSEELASLLGFDIPLTPVIDLAGVKADGVIVHWTLSAKQKQKSTLKYEIYLNGRLIDTLPIHESAVTITGLQPASFYVVRVALVNSMEFGSKSAPIRFRTKFASSGDFFIVTDEHETDPDATNGLAPRTRPYRGLKDITPASPTSALMTREGSTGVGLRRMASGRRLSANRPGLDNRPNSQGEESGIWEGMDTIQQLTEKLDAIRRETDEAEKQAREEEEEELKQKEELARERDELKAEATEKEKASRNLKREVNILERQNTAAQNERSKQERILMQKKQERQKLKDDVVRWQQESEELRGDVERINQTKAQRLEQAAQQREELRTKQSEESASLQTLDNDVREKTAEIKKLERALKNSSPNGSEPETNLVQQLQQDAEDERQWQTRRSMLQQQYTLAYQKLENAKRFHAEQMRYLESIRAERRRAEEVAQYSSSPLNQDRLPRRGDSQRSRHAPSRQSTSDSPRLASYSMNQSPFASGIANPPSGPFPVAPFLNIQNGMTIAGPTNEAAMTEDEKEKLTGGAPMSPGAGAELLPADLFSGDGDNRISAEHVRPLPGLGSLPGLAGVPPMPGSSPLPQTFHDFQAPGPASPASASSRSPSVFASPQASQPNLHIGSPENIMDADRRSIRSTRSNRATSGSGTGSRFSGMFGIKQRTKTMSDEGPALGKSSSMPRQDPGIPGLDSTTRKRNSSISGSVFGGPSSNDGTSDAAMETPATAPSRKTFGIFGREKSGGWPSSFTSFGRRPTSPRPGSTHSNELPRPSADGSRWGVDTWPSNDSSSAASRGSPLAFGPGWNAPGSQAQRSYGSRLPSRRPSVQYGATGPPEDIMEDDDDDSDVGDPGERNLPPIGTKPSGSKKAEKQIDSTKLNPGAKDFKSLFSGMKLSSKGKEGDRNSGASPSGPNTPSFAGIDNDESPPNSRKSRDTRSLATTESSVPESGRNSPDLVRTPSYSNSDAPGSVPSPSLASGSRETFMQKITRKSSSGKFALPTFRQREKHRLDPSSAGGGSNSSVGTNAPVPAEDDTDGLSASVGSLRDVLTSASSASGPTPARSDKEPRESKESGRSAGRNWSHVLKLGKGKKGNETPSLSGLSVASGTEDGEDEDEQ